MRKKKINKNERSTYTPSQLRSPFVCTLNDNRIVMMYYCIESFVLTKDKYRVLIYIYVESIIRKMYNSSIYD